MKRMIISGFVMLADLFFYLSVVEDFMYFKRAGEYPIPNIGEDILGEVIIGSIIVFGTSLIVFLFGLFANRRNNQ